MKEQRVWTIESANELYVDPEILAKFKRKGNARSFLFLSLRGLAHSIAVAIFFNAIYIMSPVVGLGFNVLLMTMVFLMYFLSFNLYFLSTDAVNKCGKDILSYIIFFTGFFVGLFLFTKLFSAILMMTKDFPFLLFFKSLLV